MVWMITEMKVQKALKAIFNNRQTASYWTKLYISSHMAEPWQAIVNGHAKDFMELTY